MHLHCWGSERCCLQDKAPQSVEVQQDIKSSSVDARMASSSLKGQTIALSATLGTAVSANTASNAADQAS